MPLVVYEREEKAFQFLVQFMQKHGRAPMLREMCVGLGVRSPSTTWELLERLVDKGLIRIYPGKHRRIEIVGKNLTTPAGSMEVPILGFIAAGQPIEPYTDPNAVFSIPPALVTGRKRVFVLEVRGDSMVEDGILDGDFVVVEEQETAKDGDIVVALLENGLATLKRFFREETRIRLEPANASLQPIYATDVQIQGKVVGVMRKY